LNQIKNVQLRTNFLDCKYPSQESNMLIIINSCNPPHDLNTNVYQVIGNNILNKEITGIYLSTINLWYCRTLMFGENILKCPLRIYGQCNGFHRSTNKMSKFIHFQDVAKFIVTPMKFTCRGFLEVSGYILKFNFNLI